MRTAFFSLALIRFGREQVCVRHLKRCCGFWANHFARFASSLLFFSLPFCCALVVSNGGRATRRHTTSAHNGCGVARIASTAAVTVLDGTRHGFSPRPTSCVVFRARAVMRPSPASCAYAVSVIATTAAHCQRRFLRLSVFFPSLDSGTCRAFWVCAQRLRVVYVAANMLLLRACSTPSSRTHRHAEEECASVGSPVWRSFSP